MHFPKLTRSAEQTNLPIAKRHIQRGQSHFGWQQYARPQEIKEKCSASQNKFTKMINLGLAFY